MTSVRYHAPYRDPSGYGMASRNYIISLLELGVNVEAIPKGFWVGKYSVDEEIDKILTDNEDKNLPSETTPLISHQTPTHFNVDYPGYKIGYTVHETSRMIGAWVEHINLMDEVWTASRFSKAVMEVSGVNIPIYVVPHGVDRNIFNEKLEPLNFTNIEDGTFKFLSVFQWIFRKGPDALLKAYYQEFTRDENVCLIIKTFGYSEGLTEAKRIHENILAIQSELQMDNVPPVYLLFDFYSYSELARLYNSADAFVLPTRGEAWGIPFLEAMSCGVPTIGTKWSGQTDFMNGANSLQIDVDELGIVRNMPVPWFTPNQRWAEPCLADLRRKMRRVYESKNLCTRLRREGIKTAKKWPWEKGARIMQERLKAIE